MPRRALSLVGFMGREAGSPDPEQAHLADKHGLYSTACCPKKKHTTQGRESPREKGHRNAFRRKGPDRGKDFKTELRGN